MTSRHPKLLILTTVPPTFGFLTPYADHLRAKGWTVEGATGCGDVVASFPWGGPSRMPGLGALAHSSLCRR